MRRCANDPARLSELRKAALDLGLSGRSDRETLSRLAAHHVQARLEHFICCPRVSKAKTEDNGGWTAKEEVAPKKYTQPSARPPHSKRKPDKTWLEVELLDQYDQPVPNQAYEIYKSDGTLVSSGRLNALGKAHISDLEPDDYKVSFTELDKDAFGKD